MDQKLIQKILSEQLKIMESAEQVLRDSYGRVDLVLKSGLNLLSIEQKESCEALTARFARLCDYLFSKVFRTIDQIELQDEGTAIDRLNRMEKRGIIASSHEWRSLRDLRNEIAHEYLIEKSDKVLIESHRRSKELFETVANLKAYIQSRGYK